MSESWSIFLQMMIALVVGFGLGLISRWLEKIKEKEE
jgi:hypothetical protein